MSKYDALIDIIYILLTAVSGALLFALILKTLSAQEKQRKKALAVLGNGDAAHAGRDRAAHVVPDVVQVLELEGQLRENEKVIPFRLTQTGPVIRYSFTDPDEALQLRLGDNDSRLEEVTK